MNGNKRTKREYSWTSSLSQDSPSRFHGIVQFNIHQNHVSVPLQDAFKNQIILGIKSNYIFSQQQLWLEMVLQPSKKRYKLPHLSLRGRKQKPRWLLRLSEFRPTNWKYSTPQRTNLRKIYFVVSELNIILKKQMQR